MYQILHIMGSADVGGISAVVLNYYLHMDRTQFHFDLALNSETVGRNGRRLQEMGSRIFLLPQKHKDMKGFSDGLRKILTEHHYDAIHVHHNETSYVALRIAKQMGIPCRIAHSHSTSPVSGVKDEIRRLSGCVFNTHFATQVVGCGQLAGERVFGKHTMKKNFAHVLPNAIDTDRFYYSAEERKAVREELHISNQTVIGMVGRLSEEKNPLFAVNVISSLVKEKPNSILLVVGGGNLEQSIKDEADRLGVSDHVIMLGSRDDVNRLYQGMDVLIMPSLFEGFPVAAIEAMATGLPILLSDQITREFSFGAAVQYLPISHVAPWVSAINAYSTLNGREQRQNEVKENGYSIKDTAKLLEKIYLKDIQAVSAENGKI